MHDSSFVSIDSKEYAESDRIVFEIWASRDMKGGDTLEVPLTSFAVPVSNLRAAYSEPLTFRLVVGKERVSDKV